MSQLAIGMAAVSTLLTVALQTVLPDPPRIEVHTISYSAGQITQDRTVNSDAPVFFMRWRAFILDDATGLPIPNCSGSGEFEYPTGRHAKTMPIEVWVGNALCRDLPPGRYVPEAIYIWGDDQVRATGAAFEVGG